MSSTFQIQSLSRPEKLKVLGQLVDDLFPEPIDPQLETPEWIMRELAEQDARIAAGLEKSQPWDVVKEKLAAEFLR